MVISVPTNQIPSEHILDSYLRIDYDWRMEHVNENAVRLLGLPQGDLTRQVLWDLLPDWIGGRSYYDLHRAMADRTRTTFEDYWPSKDLWIQVTAIPVEDGIAILIRDNTAIRQLGQALQESQERFRLTFEEAAVGIGHIALDGRWLRVNQKLCEILGYSVDELLIRAAQTITHPDDLGKELDFLHNLLSGRIATYTMEKRFIHKFGSPVWVEATVSLVKPPSGGSRYLLAFVEETAKRRAADECLRRQLVINRSITDSTAEGLFMLDSSGRVTFINPAAEQLIGCPAEEVLGAPLHAKVLHTRPDGTPYPAPECPLNEVLASGVSVRNHEDYFIRKDGSFVPVLCSAAPIVDPSGMIMGAVLAVHDESELKAIQTRLKSLYDREHRIAETLQRSLLMMPPRDAFPGLEIESRYVAAWDEAQVGGDFCDAISLGPAKVALVVGDVAGKGLAAAARTAEIKFTLRTFLREHNDPSTALERLNGVLVETQAESERDGNHAIVTLALAVLDTKSGALAYAAAGSEPSLIVRRNATVDEAATDDEAIKVDGIAATGLPLGAFESARYHTSRHNLNFGDILIMLTDGLTEARNGLNFFGHEGVARLAIEARSEPTLQQVGFALMDGAQAFAGGRLQDDACIILARRRSENP